MSKVVTFEIAGYDEFHNELFKVSIDGEPLKCLFSWVEILDIIDYEKGESL